MPLADPTLLLMLVLSVGVQKCNSLTHTHAQRTGHYLHILRHSTLTHTHTHTESHTQSHTNDMYNTSKANSHSLTQNTCMDLMGEAIPMIKSDAEM